jgi:hypothetical protein
MGRLLNTKYFIPIWLVTAALVSGCSEDSTSPIIEKSEYSGVWDAVSITNPTGVLNMNPGSVYWFFDDQGRFCSKSRNAFGEYGSAFCGKVSATDNTLAEGLPDSIVRTWKLFLIGDADSLKAELLEATVPAADSWLLVRAETSVPADCFCD